MADKRPAFKENIHRLFDEAQTTDLAPGIVSLIESRATQAQMREVPIGKILPNPAQPRLSSHSWSRSQPARAPRATRIRRARPHRRPPRPRSNASSTDGNP